MRFEGRKGLVTGGGSGIGAAIVSRLAADFTVEGPLLTDVGGTIGLSVLSTPGMIAMMERTIGIGTHQRRVIQVPGSEE